MNKKLTNLTESDLRKLLIEESKKFNAAITFGSPVGDMEEIHEQIREIKEILERKVNASPERS